MGQTFQLKDCPNCHTALNVPISRKTCKQCGSYYNTPPPMPARALVTVIHVFNDGTVETFKTSPATSK